jgi:hypothetical protein
MGVDETTPEKSGAGAIETKTNDFPLSGGSCLSTHLILQKYSDATPCCVISITILTDNNHQIRKKSWLLSMINLLYDLFQILWLCTAWYFVCSYDE